MNYTEEKKDIEKKFQNVKGQLEQANLQAKGLADELQKLQGEFRVIERMEKEDKSTNKK